MAGGESTQNLSHARLAADFAQAEASCDSRDLMQEDLAKKPELALHAMTGVDANTFFHFNPPGPYVIPKKPYTGPPNPPQMRLENAQMRFSRTHEV